MKTFEDLDAFKRAVELMTLIYKVTATFPKDERYGLTAQMRRAAVSVVSNIAEGQGRLSRGEWRQFLSHSRGSLFELQAQTIAAEQLALLSGDDYRRLRSAIRRTAMPLSGLIAYVQNRERPSTGSRELRTR